MILNYFFNFFLIDETDDILKNMGYFNIITKLDFNRLNGIG